MDGGEARLASFRHENALVSNFLTAVASVLIRRGLLSGREGDALRMALTAPPDPTRSLRGGRSESLLVMLQNDQCEFVRLAQVLFGTRGVSHNLLRLGLMSPLDNLVDRLASCATELLAKAHLYLNRPLLVYQGVQAERQILLSTVFVDWAESFLSAAATIRQVRQQLNTMFPSHYSCLGDMRDVDGEIAAALGFSQGVASETVPNALEDGSLGLIASAVRYSARYSSQVATLFNRNGWDDQAHDAMLSLCDGLVARATHLGQTTFPEYASLSVWETRRLDLMQNMLQVVEQIGALADVLRSAYTTRDVPHAQALSGQIPEEQLRRVVADLVASGIPIHEALAATERLKTYCQRNQVMPHEVLREEIGKIHTSLTMDSFERLQVRMAPSTAAVALNLGEKAETMRKSGRIQAGLQALAGGATGVGATTLVMAMVAAFGLGGCGLKTLPRGNIDALRPEIPTVGGTGQP